MGDTNKVYYGLCNVHYALVTFDAQGVPTYGTPKALKGAVNLNLSPEGGDDTPFYADNITYYLSPGVNNGYSGNLEVALVPDDFIIDCMGGLVDANGMLLEIADKVSKPFALLFEFDGDSNKTRHVLYHCTASRSDFGSGTIEETVEPRTETLSLTAIPQTFSTQVSEGVTVSHTVVKAKCNATDSPTQYNAWFTALNTPQFTAEA